MILNDGQQAALGEILASLEDGKQRHLLTGFAGTGKTTLMQAVVRSLVDKGVPVVVTAPTHKAVHVLAGKLAEAGLSNVESMTIHSLLGLKPAAGDSERSVLKRSGRSKTDEFKAVVRPPQNRKPNWIVRPTPTRPATTAGASRCPRTSPARRRCCCASTGSSRATGSG